MVCFESKKGAINSYSWTSSTILPNQVNGTTSLRLKCCLVFFRPCCLDIYLLQRSCGKQWLDLGNEGASKVNSELGPTAAPLICMDKAQADL